MEHLQLSIGVGINPGLEDVTINLSAGFQQNVPLPTNITQLQNPPNAGRSLSRVGNWDVYGFMENQLER